MYYLYDYSLYDCLCAPKLQFFDISFYYSIITVSFCFNYGAIVSIFQGYNVFNILISYLKIS